MKDVLLYLYYHFAELWTGNEILLISQACFFNYPLILNSQFALNLFKLYSRRLIHYQSIKIGSEDLIWHKNEQNVIQIKTQV